MNQPDLSGADFAKARRWLARTGAADLPLVLCNANGTVIRQGPTPADAALADQVAGLSRDGFAWPFDGGGLGAHALGDGHTLMYRPVECGTDRIGWLATRVSSFEAGSAPVGLDTLAETFEDLATSLGEECR